MSVRVALRAVGVATVAVLAGVLVWHLTHQPPTVAPQVARHQIVRAPNFTLEVTPSTADFEIG